MRQLLGLGPLYMHTLSVQYFYSSLVSYFRSNLKHKHVHPHLGSNSMQNYPHNLTIIKLVKLIRLKLTYNVRLLCLTRSSLYIFYSKSSFVFVQRSHERSHPFSSHINMHIIISFVHFHIQFEHFLPFIQGN